MDCSGVDYTVKSGDTIWSIARRFLGSGKEWRRIFVFNNDSCVLASGGKRINDPNKIWPGDVIRIPVPQAQTARTPVTPASTLKPSGFAKMPGTISPFQLRPAVKPVSSLKPEGLDLSLLKPETPTILNPRSAVFSYLNVNWYMLETMPVHMIVNMVLTQCQAAKGSGALQVYAWVQEWAQMVGKTIQTKTVVIKIPSYKKPTAIQIGSMRFKWKPVLDESTPDPTDFKQGQLDAISPIGTLSIVHENLEKITAVGLKLPVSSSFDLSANYESSGSIGLKGSWKTEGDAPDYEIGSTLVSKEFKPDYSLHYNFGIKAIKIKKNIQGGVQLYGPINSLKEQNIQLQLKFIF